MKPLHAYAPPILYDLTEAKLHVLTDPDGTRRIVALIPKAWDKKDKQTKRINTGKDMQISPYLITDWDEVELARIPPAAL